MTPEEYQARWWNIRINHDTTCPANGFDFARCACGLDALWTQRNADLASVVWRCCRVESWVFGYYTVKYDNEKELVKKPLMGMRHCPKDAVVHVYHAGMMFHWCPEHAKEPKAWLTP